MLCACARVEAHDEVVTDVVCSLQFARRLREKESAPVGHAADDALGIEDDFAGRFGDSEARIWSGYG